MLSHLLSPHLNVQVYPKRAIIAYDEDGFFEFRQQFRGL